MRQVTVNEIVAADTPGHYMYVLHKQKSRRRSETRQMIETAHWRIGRLIEKNGRPLTPKEQKKEDERLERLLTDPEALRKEEEEQREDENRVRALFRALPDAFLYEQVETERSEGDHDLVKLRFQPNPSYEPPSRELRVLRGMGGTMVIDATAGRIVRVDARLLDDVEFGWGVLGYVGRGGSFRLVQRDVGSGRWATEALAMHFRGKVLLLKPLRVDLVIRTSGFRRMRDDLTLQEGFALLEKRDDMRAGTGQETRIGGGQPGTAHRNRESRDANQLTCC